MINRFCWLSTLIALTVLACGGDEEEPAQTCGDGLITGAETCDDGNPTGGDGCSVACRLEPGFTCAVEGFACSTTCGDNITAGTEQCDDGNADSGDGCSSTCTSEANPEPETECADLADNDQDGFVDCADSDCLTDDGVCVSVEDCSTPGDEDGDGRADCDDSDCASVCSGEVCDDGVDNDGDEQVDCADSDCECSTCGDGNVDENEECDDGEENGLEPNACRPDCVAPTCGDGILDTGEVCDQDEPGVCATDCGSFLSEVCEGERSIVDVSFPNAGETSRLVSIPLGRDAADNHTPPVDCTRAPGADTAVRVDFNDAGLYQLRLQGVTLYGAALSLGTACVSTDRLCSVGSSSDPAARLLVQIDEPGSRLLYIDRISTLAESVGLVFDRVDTVIDADGACDPESTSAVCDTGLSCQRNVSGEFFCSAAQVVASGEGDPCGGAAGACAAGLECISNVCAIRPGSSCAEPLELEEVLVVSSIEPAVPYAIELEPRPAGDISVSDCGASSNYELLTFTSPVDGVLRLGVTAEDRGDGWVAIRELCDSSVSTVACATAGSSNSGRLELILDEGEEFTLVVGGDGSTLTVNFTFFEYAASGGPCGASASGQICLPGQFCDTGTCADAGPGSCGEPTIIADPGAELVSVRGVSVGVNTGAGVAIQSASCGGAGPEQVFEVLAPVAGELSATLLDGPSSRVVSIRTFCDDASSELACSDTTNGTQATALVAAGQRVYIHVDGESPFTGTMNVQLSRRITAGSECVPGLRCIEGTECVDNVCQWIPLEEGERCSTIAGAAPCDRDLVCWNFGIGATCTPVISQLDNFCDTTGVGPQCGKQLTCDRLAVPLPTCISSGADAGEPCDDDDACAFSLVCTRSVCAERLRSEGELCGPTLPCGIDLECRDDGAGSSRCFSNRVALGGSCAVLSCDFGLNCRTEDSICIQPGFEGATCGAGAPFVDCVSGTTCVGSVCTIERVADGEACVTSANCAATSYCRTNLPAPVCAPKIRPLEPCVEGGPVDQCTSDRFCSESGGSFICN